MGKFAGEQDTWLFLREENAEPLSDIELDFLDRVMLLVHSLAVGVNVNNTAQNAVGTQGKDERWSLHNGNAPGVYQANCYTLAFSARKVPT